MDEDAELTTLEEIEALDREIERLKVMYQQYFLGTLKQEPLVLRKACYRQILRAQPAKVRNTSVRFRLRNILQKWNGYQTYWNRIVREIEVGTYRPVAERLRARQAARQRAADRGPRSGGVHEISDDLSPVELQRQLEEAVAREVASQERSVTPTPFPGGSGAGPTKRQVEEEFRRLLLQRQDAGLAADGLTLEDAARSLIERGGT